MNEKKKNKIMTIVAIFIIVSSFVIASTVLYVYVLKPQNSYNVAMELYNNGSYEEAKLKFQEIAEFKDSKEKIASCDEEINKINEEIEKNKVTDTDVMYANYYDIVSEVINKYGSPKVQPDLFNADFDTYEVANVCLVKLIDFNNDGKEELVVGYKDKKDNKMAYDVYAYIDGAVSKIIDAQEVEYRAQDCGYISIEFYKENDITYLYKWDSTCALDEGYLKSFDGTKFVDFKQWRSDENACYVDSKEVDDKDYLSSFPHYEIDIHNGNLDPTAVKEYHYEQNGMDVYVIYFMSKNAADDLLNDINSNIDLLKASNDKVENSQTK